MDLSEFFSGSITYATVLSALIVLIVLIVAFTSSVVLVFGVFQRIRWSKDKYKANLARKKIIYSIIGLMTAFFAWFIINLISAFFGISIGAEPTYIPLWKCSPTAIRVIFQNKLSHIHSCDVNDTEVDGVKGKLVYIKHGPVVSCGGLFCSYKDFTVVIVNNNTVKVRPEPDINNLLTKQYGNWCEIGFDIEQSDLKKTFSSTSDKLLWNFEFKSYSNQSFVLEKMINDRNLATNENPQSCIFNGRLLILSQTDFEAVTADFSELNVEKQKITSVTPYPLNQVTNYCNEWGGDLCYFSLAVARSEFKYCQLIKKYEEKDRCLNQVARDTAQIEVCDLISDSFLRSLCKLNIEKK